MSLIDELIKKGHLRSPEIIDAFKRVKRGDFLLDERRDEAELNAPLPIGYGQTISQPLTVAFMFEELMPREEERILDVGSGSGWTVALLSNIVGERGWVYGVEKIKELKEFAERNVEKYDFIDEGIAKILEGDGYEGLPEFAPFDKIIVAACAPEIPKRLLEQLAIGGRLVVPVGEEHGSQEIVRVVKIGDNKFNEKRFPGFVFVPLVK